jgi:hypothetical protein
MSNINSPRILKLNKLPKGKFTWKVVLQMGEGHSLDHYTRYSTDSNPLSPQMEEYLRDNINGNYSIHWIDHPDTLRKKLKKADYILMDNQIDVSLFKLCFGYVIRQIYKIEVKEKPAC